MKVFLTGASSGIGEALARHYAAQGATLGLFARREAELARLAAALAPATVATYAGDVRDAAALARAGADFIARFGAPDIVIANAGISRGMLTGEADDMPRFKAVFDTNVQGIVQTFQPFLAAMMRGAPRRAGRRGQRGRISRPARLGRLFGIEGRGDHLSRKPARRTAGTGVAVVTICPGFIATPMTARNPYRMPFLLAPDKAARLIARAIDAAAAVLCAAVADGVGRAAAEAAAAPALRFRVRRARTQAAAVCLKRVTTVAATAQARELKKGRPKRAALSCRADAKQLRSR